MTNAPDIVQMLRWCNDGISNEAADEIERLRAINVGLINARAAAAEVLGRVAYKLPVTCCECRRVLEQMEAVK